MPSEPQLNARPVMLKAGNFSGLP